MATVRGLSGKMWPIHPHLQDGELLSSWMARTSYENNLKINSFTSEALGKVQVWNRDIDSSATSETLFSLSRQTGVSFEELKSAMLSSYEGKIFEKHNPNGCTKWILPLGIFHRTRHKFGLQYCPECIFFDQAPYYRKKWRLALSTICDEHGLMLHDRCPCCGSPVIFFRNDLGYRSGFRIGDLVSCWKCDYDLSRSPHIEASGPDGKGIFAQRSLITFADMGWWFQGTNTIHYSTHYFDVLHHLVALLGNKTGHILAQRVAHETNWDFSSLQLSPNAFERCSVSERHNRIQIALWLLDDWPFRFIDISKKSNILQSKILHSEEFPFWFESEIRLSLSAGLPSPTKGEADSAAIFLKGQGQNVNQTSVGRLIGSRDTSAASAYKQAKPAPLSNNEFEQILAAARLEVVKRRPLTARRLELERDITIFRLLRLTGWPPSTLLALELPQLTSPKQHLDLMITQLERFEEEIAKYLCDIRPHLASENSGVRLFIGWKRGGIESKNWGLRAKRLRDLLSSSETTESGE